MLRDLQVENLALVKLASLTLEPGFTVFTGETGAGKSLLMNALGLAAGGKGDPALVRAGAEKAVVEAVFDKPILLPDGEFPVEGDELIIRREIPAQGRQKTLVNGAQLPVEKLPPLAAYLIEIHGQHAGQKLLREDLHLQLLDRYAELEREGSALRILSSELFKLRQAAGEDEGKRKARAENLALLNHELDALARANLSAADFAALDEEHGRLAQGEKIKTLAAAGYEALYEAEDSLLAALAKVAKSAEELQALDAKTEAPRKLVEEAKTLLKEAAYAFRDRGERVGADAARFAEVEKRLSLYHDLIRRHGGSLESAVAARSRLARERDALESERKLAEQAAAQLPGKSESWKKAAAALQKKREAAAAKLSREIEAELAELGLEKLRFSTDFLAIQNPGPLAGGSHAARFMIAPNAGEPPRPLSRIASGGELSRVMLALSLVLAPEQGLTILFDEADAGVGGAIAEAVGRRLQRLAKGIQVLCVTHLPQIAARADQHYRVVKSEIAGRTLTAVETLDAQGREDELSRMLAGDKVTPTARAHARALLKSARGD